jgi:transcriptional regulator with XRE-family HTH domain
MSEKASITPNLLRWARESARMTLDVAAAKVPTKPEKLEEWENGVSQPTIKQVQILAKAYKRPLAVFFLPIFREILKLCVIFVGRHLKNLVQHLFYHSRNTAKTSLD